jgi:uncharacterized protein (TIGR02466 family)
MEISPIFSVAIGKSNNTELLKIAKQLFADNQDKLQQGQNNLFTTLQRYNAKENSAVLNNQSAVNKIKEAILQNAIAFYAGLGFDVDQLDFDIPNLWLNQMKAGSSHTPHSHYGYQLSGCFYVNVPANSNLIKLYTPIKKIEHGDNPEKILNQYNAQYYVNHVDAGDMLFWESMLTHEVPDLQFDGVRQSIAYDISISKKIYTERKYNMNLQDYVAIYNINDLALCKQVIETMEEDKWEKHSYADPITNKHTTYDDDLDMSYQSDEVTNKLQSFFEKCAHEYLNTVAPNKFDLQSLTRIRFNRYKVGTNMKGHHDHIHTIFDGEKKGVPILSFLALLNNDFEGGDFLMFDGKKLKLVAGDVIVFPSNFLYPHAVTTITKGTRYSCVSWGY